MIPSIAQQGPMQHMAHRRGAGGPEMPPAAAGAAAAPGQIAKTMIAEAIAGGAELPANIQGKAASAIAHGVDMESFFATFMPVVEPPAGDDAGEVAGEVAGGVASEVADGVPADGESAPPVDAGDGAIPAPESGAASPPAPDPDGEAAVSLIGAVVSSYEVAASLLEPLVEPENSEVV